MPEGTFQVLSTPLSGEQPFNGDLLEGEIAVNTVDGRIWTGDPNSFPVELGGAVKNRPVGTSYVSNYVEVDLSFAYNLPISNLDPSLIPVGFYQECRYILKFPTDISMVSSFTSYFDYPINWGLKSIWDPTQSATYDNPIDRYKKENQVLVIELSSFGPSNEWMGRLLWAKLT